MGNYTNLETAVDDLFARGGTLQELSSLLHDAVDHYDWVGFYLAQGRDLLLGPYVGEPTEHVRIPFGQGICGQAAESGKTFVVPDVTAESNYLACSLKVRSEIVVPIISNGEILGEIDIDSHTPEAFTEEDTLLLEKIASKLPDLVSNLDIS